MAKTNAERQKEWMDRLRAKAKALNALYAIFDKNKNLLLEKGNLADSDLETLNEVEKIVLAETK